MVCAAYRDEALKQSNIFRWYGWYHDGQEDIHDNLRRGCPSDSWRDGNIKKVRQLLLQYCHLSLRMIVDELEISQDTVEKIVTENLKKGKFACTLYHLHWLQNCTICIDCRTSEGLTCCLSRFDWDGWQWSWVLPKKLKLVMNLGALLTTQQRNNNHLCGLEKICRCYRNFDSRSFKWRTWWWYVTGRESCTKNLYQKGRFLTVNSTEKGWTEIWKDFGALGQIRLNQVTGSCCTIMLLPTNQAVSHKEKHYYSLPTPYLPDLAPMDYFLPHTTADIPEYYEWIKNCYSSWVQWRHSEALWLCQ